MPPAPPRRRTGTSGWCRPAVIPVCCGSSWTTRPTCAKTAGWGCAPAMSSRCLASAASRWFTMSVTAPGRDFYTAPRARLSAAWHRLQYRAIARTCKQIVTVSQFSRSELQKYYGVSPDRVTVVPNAWQHMQRVAADEGVFAKWPQLRRGEYYFSMSNLLKNKNFPGYCRRPAASRTPCLPLPAAATWPRRRAGRGCSPRPTCSAWAMSRTARPRR